ncbi:dihydropyrimidinase [Deinococcus radiopugnans]|uniref:Dihydropyrimidinase n=1 Tax=Deinococcus radiopugnans ATCC 19172 TaxID=585398 RepID=A0A5C4YBC0_9DEIO|nr:dihydropyrimidinase [Deinococcus radiopugnans]MBB6015194.1 dihydropyrimidinase [Deinococcus radiopugnans ATCC 19172]TNM73098.1 dihydropyrimidinase [Deinococcus radiopugnans ATCC 19172]
MSLIISGGTVVTAEGQFQADVRVDGGQIAAVGRGLAQAGDEVIDADGKHILPGGIDVHTHLSMPSMGTVTCDDYYTGQVAAVMGGTTTHLDFCIQPKGSSLKAALDTWHGRARGQAVIDYGFHVAVTDPLPEVLDEIATLPDQGVTSIKLFLAYKDTLQVDDTALFRCLERARDAGVLTLVHAENGDAIEVLMAEAVARGETAPKYHALTRPPELEAEATGRAVALAEVLGAPLYIVHLSCRPALVRVREAQARGARVTAETCTQYFFFTKDDLDRPGFEGAKWVCSPPPREKEDQQALWAAVADGTLSVISTDHCPFRFDSQKTLGRDDFTLIPNGVPGIEERLMVLHQAGVRGGHFSLERFVALTATNPARSFGLGGVKGSVAPGYDADLALWNLARPHMITAATNHSAVDYSLYEGMAVQGRPVTVLIRGQTVMHEGRLLAERGSGQFLHRQRI